VVEFEARRILLAHSEHGGVTVLRGDEAGA